MFLRNQLVLKTPRWNAPRGADYAGLSFPPGNTYSEFTDKEQIKCIIDPPWFIQVDYIDLCFKKEHI